MVVLVPDQIVSDTNVCDGNVVLLVVAGIIFFFIHNMYFHQAYHILPDISLVVSRDRWR